EESHLESAHSTASDSSFRELVSSDMPKPPVPPFAAAASASGDDSGVAAFGTPQPFGMESATDVSRFESSAYAETGAVAGQSGPALANERTEVSAASEA